MLAQLTPVSVSGGCGQGGGARARKLQGGGRGQCELTSTRYSPRNSPTDSSLLPSSVTAASASSLSSAAAAAPTAPSSAAAPRSLSVQPFCVGLRSCVSLSA